MRSPREITTMTTEPWPSLARSIDGDDHARICIYARGRGHLISRMFISGILARHERRGYYVEELERHDSG